MKNRRRFLSGLLLSAIPVVRAVEETAMAAGVRAFMDGKMEEALSHWDRQIAADPASAPHHWQRGLALYYAKKYKEGQEQFESHQKVNPQDVENAVWHFLCVARLQDPAAARRQFIRITADPRVPMKEIHALFAGKVPPETVLEAAGIGAAGYELRNQQCYAHLYLGLYHEAHGDSAAAKHHLVKAAGEFRMDHYMGKVAQVHCQLRGWPVPPAGEAAKDPAKDPAKAGDSDEAKGGEPAAPPAEEKGKGAQVEQETGAKPE